MGTLTFSDLAPHRQEPEGQSAVRPAHSVFIGPQAAFVVPYDPVHFVGYSVGNMTGTHFNIFYINNLHLNVDIHGHRLLHHGTDPFLHAASRGSTAERLILPTSPQ